MIYDLLIVLVYLPSNGMGHACDEFIVTEWVTPLMY